jgi:hypothetical protein
MFNVSIHILYHSNVPCCLMCQLTFCTIYSNVQCCLMCQLTFCTVILNVSIHITWNKVDQTLCISAISAIIMLNITRVVVTLLAIVCYSNWDMFKLHIWLERWTHRAHYARLTYSQLITYLWRSLSSVLLYQKTLNYVDVRVMILAELIVVFINKFLTIF